MNNNSVQTVDIDGIIRNKNPRLYKLLPGFVLNYIKRIVHQDEVNTILTAYGKDCRGAQFCDKILEHLNVTYRVENESNLPPADGRYIFASNHPLGALDGIVLIALISKHYSKVKFVVNDLLMYLSPLEDVFTPVNKHGRQSAEYARRIDELYSSETQVLYFPAGLCSRRIKGVISDLEWKKSFVTKAIRYERDLVPVYFEGSNSNFFYNLANFRKKLGIKANLEMFYLSDEFFNQRNVEFTVRIGETIPRARLAAMKANDRVQFVRDKVYAMR
jgi:putative hemolysin